MNLTVILIFIFYASAILSLQYIKINSPQYRYLVRKSVHLITGLIIFFLTFQLDKNSLLILISTGTVFSVITYNLKKFNFIHTTSGSSLGTLFYPFGLLISILLLYNMPVYYFRISLMILSVSDTLANLCGEIKKLNIRFAASDETKSILGVAGFALSALLIHLILLPEPLSRALPYIILSVIAAVNFEVISFRGSDNFSIPVGCSLFFLLTKGNNLNSGLLILLILLTAAGSVMLYKKNILTRYGSIGAYILGVYFFSILGLTWSIPIITFFITSVIFTRINGIANRKHHETNRRNIWQVCANIFFAAASSACYLITDNHVFIYFFITLIATVTADTWASELGPVFTGKCLSLSDLKIKSSGVSGGISLPGTITALAGSLIISALSYYLFFNKIDPATVAILTLAAFAATFIDSILSAFLEPQLMNMKFFKNNTGSDSPSPNDIVNLLASLTAPGFYILFKIMI